MDTIVAKMLCQPKLAQLGFSWEEDVEDVVPVTFQAMRRFLKDTPNPLRQVFTIRCSDVARLRSAAEHMLQSWQILRSIAVDTDDETPLLVILRCNERYIQQAISPVAEVQNEEELVNVPLLGEHSQGAVPRRLLYTVAIAKIVSAGTYAWAHKINHAIMDYTSSSLWFADMTAMLTGRQTHERVPWSLFGHMYHSYRSSLPAQEAAAAGLRRLQGISRYQASLRPPLRPHMYEPPPTAMQETTENQQRMVSHSQIIHISSFRPDRCPESIRPAILTKASIALFNSEITHTPTVLLAVVLSGRSWPFLSPPLTEFLPSAKHIAGPTISMATDVIHLRPTETISKLLSRLDREQALMTRHQHCPISMLDELSLEDSKVWALARRQMFNWLPWGSEDPDPHAAAVKRGDKTLELIADKGANVEEPADELMWRCRMVDEERLKVEVRAGREMFAETELDEMVKRVCDLVCLLADRSNGEKTVEEIVRSYGYNSERRG
ncbi:MAG: hypothetical protein Q9169_004471 [Polycauliona sp. 2 TL-2023]